MKAVFIGAVEGSAVALRAICAAGPPKDRMPMRPKVRHISGQ